MNHRGSKWADDAIVLHAEALVRAGQCPLAGSVLDTAIAVASTPALRERAALAAATCALQRGRPGEVPGLAAPVLASQDHDRRSRAQWIAGDAAAARGDFAVALEHYRHSTERRAGAASVRLLLALDRGAEALDQLERLATGRFDEPEWTALLDETARSLGAARTSAVLDRVLSGMRVPQTARTRLLLADGDRLYAAGAYPPARTRYAAAAEGPPGLTETDLAAVRLIKARAAQAERREDLMGLADAAQRASGRPGSTPAVEAARFSAIVTRVGAPDSTEVAAFHAAELARDSLRARVLAADLFEGFADRYPASLFAPKALVAALVLRADAQSEVLERLQRDYAESPYTLALRGDASPGFGAAEDSLARALGMPLERPRVSVVARLAEPLPGPLGPWEDLVFRTVASATAAGAVADTLGPGDPRLRGRPVRPQQPPSPGQPRPGVRP